MTSLQAKRDAALAKWEWWDCSIQEYTQAYESGERDFRFANLAGANLTGANLISANLTDANLADANLADANLERANLERANLAGANLISANLADANLISANLADANLAGANLTQTKGLISQIDYLTEKFEQTVDGIIAYKTFGAHYAPPSTWNIEAGSVLKETVNFSRNLVCGCGVNVSTLDWQHKEGHHTVWKCLIRWQWMAGICVPYHTDGKVRCECVQLLKQVSIDEEIARRARR